MEQHTIALLTTEAEIISVRERTNLVLIMRSIRDEWNLTQGESTCVIEDNQGTIAWSNTIVRKFRHVSIRFIHVKHRVTAGSIDIGHCNTKISL